MTRGDNDEVDRHQHTHSSSWGGMPLATLQHLERRERESISIYSDFLLLLGLLFVVLFVNIGDNMIIVMTTTAILWLFLFLFPRFDNDIWVLLYYSRYYYYYYYY